MQITRLLKNSEGNRNGGWIFCRGTEADVALFSQITRLRKIRKICEANLRVSLPKTGPLRFGSGNQFPLNFAHEYILVQK